MKNIAGNFKYFITVGFKKKKRSVVMVVEGEALDHIGCNNTLVTLLINPRI